MGFVVIKTSGKDLVKGHPLCGKVHPDYPVEVEEFESLEAAKAAHPCVEPMPVEYYHGFKTAMNISHGVISPAGKRKWWKFWSK